MDVDISDQEQDVQSEVDSDDYDVRHPEKKRWKPNDFHEKEYFKEVYRVIVNNMDYGTRLEKLCSLSFVRKYRLELKYKNYSKPDAYFDAWMCVMGRKRKEFNPRQLIIYYPGVKDRIKKIREICHVSPQYEDIESEDEK